MRLSRHLPDRPRKALPQDEPRAPARKVVYSPPRPPLLFRAAPETCLGNRNGAGRGACACAFAYIVIMFVRAFTRSKVLSNPPRVRLAAVLVFFLINLSEQIR